MVWIVHDREKAEAAGCHMEMHEIIYVLTVSDVAQAYDDLAEERAEDDGETVAEDPWGDLLPEVRERMVIAATKSVEHYMGTGGYDWHDAVLDGITEVEQELKST